MKSKKLTATCGKRWRVTLKTKINTNKAKSHCCIYEIGVDVLIKCSPVVLIVEQLISVQLVTTAHKH